MLVRIKSVDELNRYFNRFTQVFPDDGLKQELVDMVGFFSNYMEVKGYIEADWVASILWFKAAEYSTSTSDFNNRLDLFVVAVSDGYDAVEGIRANLQVKSDLFKKRMREILKEEINEKYS